MDELREGYIQIEEMSRFRNKVRQVRQKHNKWEGNTKTNLHTLNAQLHYNFGGSFQPRGNHQATPDETS